MRNPEAILAIEARFRDLSADIRRQIKVRLAEKDMNQTDLAQVLGISRAAVSSLLTREGRNLRLKTLIWILYALDADVEVRVIPRMSEVPLNGD